MDLFLLFLHSLSPQLRKGTEKTLLVVFRKSKELKE
jgi:hypothetical protein